MSKRRASKPRARYKVDRELLVREWTLAQSLEDCAQRMGLPRHTIANQIRKLRAAGVPLKNMRDASIDVDKLTKIVRETEES